MDKQSPDIFGTIVGDSVATILDRQLALQQQTINNNENFGFRPVEVDFNALPIELRNTNILLSK